MRQGFSIRATITDVPESAAELVDGLRDGAMILLHRQAETIAVFYKRQRVGRLEAHKGAEIAALMSERGFGMMTVRLDKTGAEPVAEARFR